MRFAHLSRKNSQKSLRLIFLNFYAYVIVSGIISMGEQCDIAGGMARVPKALPTIK